MLLNVVGEIRLPQIDCRDRRADGLVDGMFEFGPAGLNRAGKEFEVRSGARLRNVLLTGRKC